MDRRTFIRGAVIAAATPAVALAPTLIASLGHLIGQHASLDEMFQAADAKAGEIGKDPSKPAYPHIYAHEFGPYRSGMSPIPVPLGRSHRTPAQRYLSPSSHSPMC